MKKTCLSGFLAIASVSMAITAANAADLAITLTGIRSQDGRIMVAVYDRADAFMKPGQAIAAFDLAVRGDAMTVVLADVAPGGYAVSAYHDENGNGELDKNLIGIPTEGYGFSNGASGAFGPPDFDGAAVNATDGRAVAAVTFRY